MGKAFDEWNAPSPLTSPPPWETQMTGIYEGRCNYALLGFKSTVCELKRLKLMRKFDGGYFFGKKLRCCNLTFELFSHPTQRA